MHIHLVQFQILDRQAFQVVGHQVVPTGERIPPPASEAGFKDTAKVPPGQILRVIARFTEYTGNFVFHCHMLEHEDNDMMRQFTVLPRGGHAPVVAAARAEPSRLWPPDRQLEAVRIVGVRDAGGNPAEIHITGVTQDEPISGGEPAAGAQGSDEVEMTGGHSAEGAGPERHDHADLTCVDARIDGLGQVSLRRDRKEDANGRVYRISFMAVGKDGGSAPGSVTVVVPTRSSVRTAVDDGQSFHSLDGCPVTAPEAMAMQAQAMPSRPAPAATALAPPRVQGRTVRAEYSLAEASEVSLSLYDLAGRRVAGVDEVMRDAGNHSAAIALNHLSRGIYFLRMRVAGKSYDQRLVVRSGQQ
jgi:hypothetical protein